MEDKATLIEAENLSFSYQREPVLDGVSFQIFRGDYVSIIGSNGAGKSTLLRLLLGELSPHGGQIYLLGQPIAQFRYWSRIGYVPQNGVGLAAGFPATAAEVVTMGLYRKIGPFRLPGSGHREQVREALASVGMKFAADQPVGNLSGGQMQRVLIARALVAESVLLLLDEPVTGVDGPSAIALYELLAELNRTRRLTVVMVTHDIARSADYTNRTLCLEHGSLVELDEEQMQRELASRHRHP